MFCSNLFPWSLHGYTVYRGIQTTVKSKIIHIITAKYVNSVITKCYNIRIHSIVKTTICPTEVPLENDCLSLLVNATRVNGFGFAFSATHKNYVILARQPFLPHLGLAASRQELKVVVDFTRSSLSTVTNNEIIKLIDQKRSS